MPGATLRSIPKCLDRPTGGARVALRTMSRLRLVVLLAVVGVLVLGALALQSRTSDDSPSAVPAADLTPARTVPGNGNAIIPGPGTSSPASGTPATAPASARDLRADESRGGHTIARHVGRTDEQLRQRLRAEPDISAASTYPDLATAQQVVSEVLASKDTEVRRWSNRSGSRANLVLRMDLGRVVGRSIEQGESRAVECEDAVVVLRWDGNSWFVLTSYPEDR